MNAPHDISQTAGADTILREAIVYTYPLYEMARMRAATCPRRGPGGAFAGNDPASTLRWVNHLFHSRALLGPQHRQVVTPNNDTLYTNAWLDLSDGPVCVDVPDTGSRYYTLGLLDAYTNPFDGIGTSTTGNGKGRFLLHGPDWRGEVPAGMQAIACPTNATWMIGRFLVDGEADVPAVHALQDQVALTRVDGTPAAHPFDVGMDASERAADPVRYATVVNRVLRENPPPAHEAAYVTRFAAVGLGADCDPASLTPPQTAALGEALAGLDTLLRPRAPAELGGGWSLPVEILASFGDRYEDRAMVARSFIGALGVHEAMYLIAGRDADGQQLDGNADYLLAFPADRLPQVGAFWSLTMYRKSDCMLVENDLNRYSLGDRSPQLRYDADGGLRIQMGARPPADPALAGNWLPAPAEPFYVALRLYLPKEAHLRKQFVYPAIRRIGGA